MTVAINTPPKAAERRKLADEFGDLWEKRQARKPEEKRYEALRVQILGWYAEKPAVDTFTECGDSFDIGVSPRAMERKITKMRKLFQLLKPRKFFELCQMLLKDVDDNVPKDKHPLFLVHEQTGARTLTPVKKGAPA
jgi:hypothetical protein